MAISPHILTEYTLIENEIIVWIEINIHVTNMKLQDLKIFNTCSNKNSTRLRETTLINLNIHIYIEENNTYSHMHNSVIDT